MAQAPEGRIEPLWIDELIGERYYPPNGTEGAIFQDTWCCTCVYYRGYRDGKVIARGRGTNEAEYFDCTQGVLRIQDLADYGNKETYSPDWVYGERGRPICKKWRSEWYRVKHPLKPRPRDPREVTLF